MKSRLLYLPSVGFALLLATVLQGLAHKRVVPCVATCLLVFSYASLRHNLAIWGGVATLADRVCAEAVRHLTPSTERVVVDQLPPSLNGVYFYANGFPECIKMRAGKPVEVEYEGRHLNIDGKTVRLRWDERRATLDKVDERP